jgi:hypothetical protein
MTPRASANAIHPQNPTTRHLTPIWYALLLAGLALYLVRALPITDQHIRDSTDLYMYLTGANIASSGQIADLYDLEVQSAAQRHLYDEGPVPGGLLPFNYSPYVAFLFIPLASLPLSIAYSLWTLVQVLLLLLFARSIASYYKRQGFSAPKELLMGVFGFAPIVAALIWGQMSVVLLLLWWWAFISWREERWVQLGIAISLCAFKPQLAAFLIIGLLVQRRWLAVVSAAALQAVLWGLAILPAGFGIVGGYLDILRLSTFSTNTFGFFPGAMTNFRGLLSMLGVPSEVSGHMALAAWMLGLAFAVLIWLTHRPLAVRFGLITILAILLSPHLYLHDASLLFVAAIAAHLAWTEQHAKLDDLWFVAPMLVLSAGLFGLVLSDWRQFNGVIIAVWLFGLAMVAAFAKLKVSSLPLTLSVQKGEGSKLKAQGFDLPG